MKNTKDKANEIKVHICELLFPQLKKIEKQYRIYQEVKFEMIIKALEKERVLDNCCLMYPNVDKPIFIINKDIENIEWQIMLPLQAQSAETISKIHTLLTIH